MDLDRQGGWGLWRRYRQAAVRPISQRPDLPMLAAYLDGGLDEAGRERVEEWLAADPAFLDLALAAANATLATAAPQRVEPKVTAYARPRHRSWVPVAALAASVAVAALLGFELGQQAFNALTAVEDAGPRSMADLIDRSGSVEDFL